MSHADRLDAVNEAIWHVKEAMEELEGTEYEDWINALGDIHTEMEREQDELESYMTGEHRQMLADLNREYERDLLWEDT